MAKKSKVIYKEKACLLTLALKPLWLYVCEIENWRWAGVPFYVRTGKRLPCYDVTEIVIHFKTTPHPVFSQNAPENKLIIRIQPDEAISMRFGLKNQGGL